jgi:hypothetical protein
MKHNVGLWIDHRKAFVVSLVDKVEKTMKIISNMEKHVRFSGRGQEAYGEDQRDNKFTGHLNKYYDKVILCIQDADSILILGPGEAKNELKQRLEGNSLGGRVVGLETADKMTDRQITAKIRDHFSQ